MLLGPDGNDIKKGPDLYIKRLPFSLSIGHRYRGPIDEKQKMGWLARFSRGVEKSHSFKLRGRVR